MISTATGITHDTLETMTLATLFGPGCTDRTRHPDAQPDLPVGPWQGITILPSMSRRDRWKMAAELAPGLDIRLRHT